jgi:C4-dicarboxylate-specific signal transduction histidine kinase
MGGQKGVKVTSLLEEAGYASAAPRALQQVLLNIVANAADAVAGAQNREPEICLSLCKNGNKLMISVDDNGPGMSEARQKELFKPFCTTKSGGARAWGL